MLLEKSLSVAFKRKKAFTNDRMVLVVMCNELDRVTLAIDKPESNLKAGDHGTIVLVYNQGAGYEVEFCQFSDVGGQFLTLDPHEIEPCNETGRKLEQGRTPTAL